MSAAATLLAIAAGVGFDQVRWLAAHHFGQQARLVLAAFAGASSGADPSGQLFATFESTAHALVEFVSRLLPGLVLLQSVAALAAAWALYRLLARHPEGEPLPRLRDFRFNDHLIWGIVLALLALVLPIASTLLRPLGGNLATFFGGLYVARGVGVLVAVAAAAGIGGPVAALFTALVAVFLAPLVLFSTLAIGVTDTWVDWRKLTARAGKS